MNGEQPGKMITIDEAWYGMKKKRPPSVEKLTLTLVHVWNIDKQNDAKGRRSVGLCTEEAVMKRKNKTKQERNRET